MFPFALQFLHSLRLQHLLQEFFKWLFLVSHLVTIFVATCRLGWIRPNDLFQVIWPWLNGLFQVIRPWLTGLF